MRKYKTIPIILLIIAVFLLLAAPAYSVNAVIQETKGKVELKASGGSWQKAEVGMEIGLGTTVSTGFGANAKIAIGNNILEVKPLTRMELEELIEKEGTIDTELNLKVGKIKANVRSSAGLQNNFKLRSAQSTAAVRGTVFVYDGYTLSVEQGQVSLSNNLGQVRTVGRGEQSSTDGYSVPSNVEDAISSVFDLDPSALDEDAVVTFLEQEYPEFATIILNLYWDFGGVQ
ncbi:MAG: FecR domain-containing protein [Spirochaetaceae bacterium]|nr:FecR domain-containing protein [Spirochaetaceae bacterium]MCF7949799.1 FecR domain-containing protein [Spirochaetia bacterium]MCF7951335.1 FecR domain-containing protein [Spirochaetaceae bacterium]